MRRSIGAHMKRSLETAATCTTWIEADMTRIEAARKRARPDRAAVRGALRRSARCASTRSSTRGWRTTSHTVHEDVNLGIAVSLGEDGLIVPVVERAQELSAEGLGAADQGPGQARPRAAS